ncbi:MAG: DUF1289 domain-containing protein [Gammaproteobacteria bacterium CG22_combo_CG10-13_8_21_14_all_40_8]|nr:MAG: DUF1289 domain-containing protein [Gammaproteobacteria bacterium CG22_combo_CG10-13_8_21_14_all_40_8]
MSSLPENPSQSPCIGTCSTAAGDDVCKGCLRTFDEVIQWHCLTDEEKIKINQRILKEKALKQSNSLQK